MNKDRFEKIVSWLSDKLDGPFLICEDTLSRLWLAFGFQDDISNEDLHQKTPVYHILARLERLSDRLFDVLEAKNQMSNNTAVVTLPSRSAPSCAKFVKSKYDTALQVEPLELLSH